MFDLLRVKRSVGFHSLQYETHAHVAALKLIRNILADFERFSEEKLISTL